MKAGYIGTGWTEQAQIELFRAAGIEPKSICSGHKENAERVAREKNIPEVYDSWENLLKECDADLISSVTPTFLHAPIIEAAIEQERHLLSETPFLNVEEVKQLKKKAAGKPDLHIIMDYELRFDPRRVKIKEMLSRRLLGEVNHFRLSYEYDFATDENRSWSWENDRSKGGGMLRLVGGHFIDLSRWIFGAIEEVNAEFHIAHKNLKDPETGKMYEVTADDHVELELTFKSGVRGHISVNAMANGERGMGFLIEGSRGNLWLGPNERLWRIEERRRQELTFPDPDLPESVANDGFRSGTFYLGRRLKEVFSNGDDDGGDLPTLEDALATQRIIDRAYEEGQWG